jgi:hypothetical protein
VRQAQHLVRGAIPHDALAVLVGPPHPHRQQVEQGRELLGPPLELGVAGPERRRLGLEEQDQRLAGAHRDQREPVDEELGGVPGRLGPRERLEHLGPVERGGDPLAHELGGPEQPPRGVVCIDADVLGVRVPGPDGLQPDDPVWVPIE